MAATHSNCIDVWRCSITSIYASVVREYLCCQGWKKNAETHNTAFCWAVALRCSTMRTSCSADRHARSLCPAAGTDGVHHALLPSWRISEWGLRWTLRRAFPRHSYSHHCCFCWRSTLSISPRRFRSLWHISWLVSPPPCCPQPSRSSHPGGGDTVAGGKRRSRCWTEFTRTLASCSRR